MTIKILALIGSHRNKGNTARIVQMIEARMRGLAARQNTPLEWETLFLGDMEIRPCRGCRVCFDRGEESCPLKDAIPLIRAKMDAVDGLLLASPVYVDDVSGTVKTWIDRLAYLSHRPAMAFKVAYTVATVGGGPTAHTLRTMNGALLTWGYHLVGKKGLKMGALASTEEMFRYEKEAAHVAKDLFRAIFKHHAMQPSFLSLVAFKIQQSVWKREPPESNDYRYWRDKGWLDRNCTFYVPHRANPLKVALARGVGWIVSRFFL